MIELEIHYQKVEVDWLVYSSVSKSKQTLQWGNEKFDTHMGFVNILISVSVYPHIIAL